ERDFQQIAAAGFNAICCYMPPPLWLLTTAQRFSLRVMVGLPWEQHVAFLDQTSRVEDIIEHVSRAVAGCARHPALLCYAVGTEIPSSIVRWYGHKSIERFIGRLTEAVRYQDPAALVT